jgi:hypothetical protein
MMHADDLNTPVAVQGIEQVGDHSAGKLENPANTVFEQLRNDEIGNFTDGIDKRSLYLEISLLKSTPKPTSETLVPIVLMSLRDVQKTCNKGWDADPVAAPMTPNPISIRLCHFGPAHDLEHKVPAFVAQVARVQQVLESGVDLEPAATNS